MEASLWQSVKVLLPSSQDWVGCLFDFVYRALEAQRFAGDSQLSKGLGTTTMVAGGARRTRDVNEGRTRAWAPEAMEMTIRARSFMASHNDGGGDRVRNVGCERLVGDRGARSRHTLHAAGVNARRA